VSAPASDLCTLGADFDPGVREDARRRLASLKGECAVLLAVESGSRAWGFPSPDSDYDCRFLYARSRESYLSLFSQRDVIEFPLERVLDINGWDLAKALRLLLKGNAVVIEWLTSPLVYEGDAAFRAGLLELAGQVAKPALIARHYLHLGERQRRTYFADVRAVPLKKIFYALRPAIALRWLRMHPEAAVAPMRFQALVAESDLPGEARQVIDDLLEKKSHTRELGRGPLPPVIGALIDAEYEEARRAWPDRAAKVSPMERDLADAFFRKWIPERV